MLNLFGVDGGCGNSATQRPQPYRVLVAASGSVAALKLPELTRLLLDLNNTEPLKYNFEVRAVVTEHAQHFFSGSTLAEGVQLYTDADEWSAWSKRGDPVLHIELGKWAHLMLIAPLDANTLAKIAQGLCDNLLTCTARAWDPSKPLLFCPAMNTRMWRHPLTARHVAALRELGYFELPVVTKTLVCGDRGEGAMAELSTIIDAVAAQCNLARSPPHPAPPPPAAAAS